MAVNTKTGTRCASRCIDGDQTGIQRRFKNTSANRTLVFRRAGSGPNSDTAIDQPVAVIPCQLCFWIQSPSLRARFRIERDDAVERRRQIQRSVDQKGRGFKAAPLHFASAIRQSPV